MTANVAMNTNLAAPPKPSRNAVTVQGMLGGLSTGARLRMIPEMWYMARPSATTRQETRILPSTNRTNLAVEVSSIKATRMIPFIATTRNTTRSSRPLKTTKPGPLSGDTYGAVAVVLLAALHIFFLASKVICDTGLCVAASYSNVLLVDRAYLVTVKMLSPCYYCGC